MIYIYIFNSGTPGYFREIDQKAGISYTFDTVHDLQQAYLYGGARINSVVWVNGPNDVKVREYFKSRIKSHEAQ